MKIIVLKGYYDGEKICLDELCDLAPNTPLLITVLPQAATEKEREEWVAFSQAAFARAYGDNEPDYSEYVGKFPPA